MKRGAPFHRPAAREHILRGTGEGAGTAAEIRALWDAWNCARTRVRGKFLNAVFSRGPDIFFTESELDAVRAPLPARPRRSPAPAGRRDG